MIKTVIVLILILLIFIFSLPIYLFELVLGKFSIKAQKKSSRKFVAGVFRFLLSFVGVKIEVSGKENIPEEACLFVGNHNSYFDILVAYVTIEKEMGFISKKEVGKVPILRLWMSMIGCQFIDRQNVRESLKTILKAADEIKEGTSIFVFPEGTRSKDGKMLPFKEGSMKMAERSNGLIVPVAMTGTADLLENHFPRMKSGTVTIDIGKVIDSKDMSKEEKKHLGAYAQSKIQEMLDARAEQK